MKEFSLPRRSSRLALSRKSALYAESINFSGERRENTYTHTYALTYLLPNRTLPSELTRSRFRRRRRIGMPADFKVNTPLKSHQSKIESLTCGACTALHSVGTMGLLRSHLRARVRMRGYVCVYAGARARAHPPYANKNGNMTEIPPPVITNTGSGRGGGGEGGDSAGAQVAGKAYKANLDRY